MVNTSRLVAGTLSVCYWPVGHAMWLDLDIHEIISFAS